MPLETGNPPCPYTIFAAYYDQLMRHVPYPKWASYIREKSKQFFGHAPKSILDLGCGTGKLLACLQERTQARLVGIDSSNEMLKKAKRRLGKGTCLFSADLTGPFPLPAGFVELLVSTHDSLNYITEAEGLGRHFAEAGRIAQKNVLYICDFVSLSNIQRNFHGQVRKERLPGGELIWSNHYDASARLLRSHLKFASNTGESTTEIHEQRYWSRPELERILLASGWQILWEEGDYQPRPFRKGDSFHVYGLGRPTR